MTIKFMGVQDDPDMDTAEGRGFPRIYDGTKRSMLDDIYSALRNAERFISDDTCRHDSEKAAVQAEILAVMKRIDEGER
jgi:hypothetical protein